MNEYKSIFTGKLCQDIWKNSPEGIPKDTEGEQNYRKIINPQRSYVTVYQESFINYQHLFLPVQF